MVAAKKTQQGDFIKTAAQLAVVATLGPFRCLAGLLLLQMAGQLGCLLRATVFVSAADDDGDNVVDDDEYQAAQAITTMASSKS